MKNHCTAIWFTAICVKPGQDWGQRWYHLLPTHLLVFSAVKPQGRWVDSLSPYNQKEKAFLKHYKYHIHCKATSLVPSSLFRCCAVHILAPVWWSFPLFLCLLPRMDCELFRGRSPTLASTFCFQLYLLLADNVGELGVWGWVGEQEKEGRGKRKVRKPASRTEGRKNGVSWSLCNLVMRLSGWMQSQDQNGGKMRQEFLA